MLLCGAVRLAADRCSSRLGRGPDDSFPARPPTHAVGHQLTVATGRYLASSFVDLATGATAGSPAEIGQAKAGTHRQADIGAIEASDSSNSSRAPL